MALNKTMKYHFLFYSQVKMSCMYIHIATGTWGFTTISIHFSLWNIPHEILSTVLKPFFKIDSGGWILNQNFSQSSSGIFWKELTFFIFNYIAENSVGSTLTVKLSIPNHANYQWTMKHQNMILLKKHFQYSAQCTVLQFSKEAFLCFKMNGNEYFESNISNHVQVNYFNF